MYEATSSLARKLYLYGHWVLSIGIEIHLVEIPTLLFSQLMSGFFDRYTAPDISRYFKKIGMNTEQIQSFLSKKISGKNKYVKISFQKRDSIYGLFLTGEKDYKDLSSKNFWRIVTRKYFDEYNKSKNPDLARIFNGSEMTRLSLLTEEF